MKTVSVSTLLADWHGNPRLRLGGWLIAFILLVYVSLLLSDGKKAMLEQYQAMANRLGQLEALSHQKEWTDRAEAARTSLTQLEEHLWEAEGRGLANAGIQTWMEGLLKKTGLTEARVHVDPAVDVSGQEGVWRIAASVEGPLDFPKLLDLLHEVETSPRWTTVEQLDITSQSPGRFTLAVKAFFRGQQS